MVYLFGVIGVVMLALCGYGRYEHLRAEVATTKLHAMEQQAVVEFRRKETVAYAANAKAKTRTAHDRAAAAALQSRSGSLPSVASVHLSGDALRLFADATAFANGTSAAASGDPTPAAAISESALARYVADAATAYRDAYGQWQACVTFYRTLRGEQP